MEPSLPDGLLNPQFITDVLRLAAFIEPREDDFIYFDDPYVDMRNWATITVIEQTQPTWIERAERMIDGQNQRGYILKPPFWDTAYRECLRYLESGIQPEYILSSAATTLFMLKQGQIPIERLFGRESIQTVSYTVVRMEAARKMGRCANCFRVHKGKQPICSDCLNSI